MVVNATSLNLPAPHVCTMFCAVAKAAAQIKI
jgi:hypothetical protein